MRPAVLPTLAQLEVLPLVFRETIPEAYRDEMGHMNVRWYLKIYDEAGYGLFPLLGLTPDYYQTPGVGTFDLEHHIQYLREVHIGDTVALRARALGRSDKRLHYMLFMVNETGGTLASTLECINSHANLFERRTSPYPPEITTRIDAMLASHRALPWDAPVCGVMGA